jgi:hypothetical protein
MEKELAGVHPNIQTPKPRPSVLMLFPDQRAWIIIMVGILNTVVGMLFKAS